MDISLCDVQKPDQAYGDFKIDKIVSKNDDNSAEYIYRDSLLEIKFYSNRCFIFFEFTDMENNISVNNPIPEDSRKSNVTLFTPGNDNGSENVYLSDTEYSDQAIVYYDKRDLSCHR